MTTEQKTEMAYMLQRMESEMGTERARAYIALEIGHAKARQAEQEKRNKRSS